MFKGSIDGEFWYKIDLEATNPEIGHMPLMECEVGRYLNFLLYMNVVNITLFILEIANK